MSRFPVVASTPIEEAFDPGSSAAHPRSLTPALVTRWAAALDAWGAPAPVRRALDSLSSGEGTVVVTGQQPGIWGGPLYAFLKAASAVAVAERLSAATGRPAVAVFWIGADDADWDEVGWGAAPRPDLALERIRVPAPFGARRWVGNAPVAGAGEEAALRAAWARPLPPRRPPGDLGDDFARRLIGLFGSAGLLPLDARWPEVREGGGDLWRRYADARDRVAEEVRAEGRALATRGLPAPIDDDGARNGVFLLDGDFRRPAGEAGWEVEFERRLREGRLDTIGPAVLLRPALQDRLFGTAVHVVGPGEIAYLRHLAPVYRRLEVPPPVRVPRLGAVLAPRGLGDGAPLAIAVADPEAWLARRAAALVSSDALQRLETLRRRVREELEAVAAAGDVPDFESVVASAAGKIDFQLGRAVDALDRRGRRALYAAEPRLRQVSEFLRPGRGEQDRGLSGLTAELAFGDEAGPTLLDAAREHARGLTEGVDCRLILEFAHD